MGLLDNLFKMLESITNRSFKHLIFKLRSGTLLSKKLKVRCWKETVENNHLETKTHA